MCPSQFVRRPGHIRCRQRGQSGVPRRILSHEGGRIVVLCSPQWSCLVGCEDAIVRRPDIRNHLSLDAGFIHQLQAVFHVVDSTLSSGKATFFRQLYDARTHPVGVTINDGSPGCRVWLVSDRRRRCGRSRQYPTGDSKERLREETLFESSSLIPQKSAVAIRLSTDRVASLLPVSARSVANSIHIAPLPFLVQAQSTFRIRLRAHAHTS